MINWSWMKINLFLKETVTCEKGDVMVSCYHGPITVPNRLILPFFGLVDLWLVLAKNVRTRSNLPPHCPNFVKQ
jgi:hypothetical protein